MVPRRVVFGKGDSFALYRVTDNCARAVFREWQAGHDFSQGVNIMPVHILGRKPEASPLINKRLEILNFSRRTV